MTQIPHLTEYERQSAADGTLGSERFRGVSEHMSRCATCAADVACLKTLMARVQETPEPHGSLDDLWPAIQSRIEQSKVVRLEGAHGGAPIAARRRWPWIAAAATAVAAAILITTFAHRPGERALAADDSARKIDASFASVADSSLANEREANVLLNELEMQRAMLRPNTSAALDDDLFLIDRSIAELKAALARDPSNLALQRLLAASYRQKIELLKRASNAG